MADMSMFSIGSPVASCTCCLASSKMLALDDATVRDDQHELRRAVVEREAARVQFVVDVRGGAVLEAAVDRAAERRRDVARRRAGAEDARRFGRGRRSGEQRDREEEDGM